MKKKLFEISGNTVSLLGLPGRKDDKNWAIGIDMGEGNRINYVMVEQCDQFKDGAIFAKLEKLVNGDIEAGNESKIDHVLVSNRYAVLLFLDGKINREMLEMATDLNGDLIIQMFISGSMRKVIIRDENKVKYHCETVDADGNSV